MTKLIHEATDREGVSYTVRTHEVNNRDKYALTIYTESRRDEDWSCEVIGLSLAQAHALKRALVEHLPDLPAPRYEARPSDEARPWRVVDVSDGTIMVRFTYLHPDPEAAAHAEAARLNGAE